MRSLLGLIIVFTGLLAYSESKKAVLGARLVYGPNKYEGRVEVNYADPDDYRSAYGDWGTICGLGHFDIKEATVVCRMLGYSTENVKVYDRAHYRGSTSWLDVVLKEVKCLGNETTLEDCDYEVLPWNPRCSHKYDMGISCDHQYENLALKKPTTQINEDTYPSSWGNDEKRNPRCCMKDFTCFYATANNPWWAVDLGREARIHQVSVIGNRVAIHNKYDPEILKVGIMDTMPQVDDVLTDTNFTANFIFPEKPLVEADLTLDPAPTGSVVVLQNMKDRYNVFTLCDVQVFGEYITEE